MLSPFLASSFDALKSLSASCDSSLTSPSLASLPVGTLASLSTFLTSSSLDGLSSLLSSSTASLASLEADPLASISPSPSTLLVSLLSDALSSLSSSSSIFLDSLSAGALASPLSSLQSFSDSVSAVADSLSSVLLSELEVASTVSSPRLFFSPISPLFTALGGAGLFFDTSPPLCIGAYDSGGVKPYPFLDAFGLLDRAVNVAQWRLATSSSSWNLFRSASSLARYCSRTDCGSTCHEAISRSFRFVITKYWSSSFICLAVLVLATACFTVSLA
mmetsp:Transcript_2873/g.6198  ORF Transcript_2873/g.6198 Transcript_2873/m.6198 type:complete len:275 (+) Transcript_2873:168-992(+)